MKKIKFYLILQLLVFLLTSKLQGQCYNNINTLSTDWRDYPGTSSNDWNWTLTGNSYPIYLQDNLSVPSDYIELPYFCSQAPGTGSCVGFHNVEQYQYKGATKEYQDINPEDGWELLLKNFGSPNPVGQSTGGKKVDNPYFILYNKYNGKMKIYVVPHKHT